MRANHTGTKSNDWAGKEELLRFTFAALRR
jgi:hypothetical protein